MSTLLSILIIASAFAGSMFFSGIETGGYLLNRIRLRTRMRMGDLAAKRLQNSLQDVHRFIFTVLIANNIATYLLSREATRLYAGFLEDHAETAATLTLMLPLFLFGELIPKNLFRHHADVWMYHCSGLLYFSQRLLAPFTYLLKMLFNLLTGGRSRTEEQEGLSLSLQGFREYFSEKTQNAPLSSHQHGMIDNLAAMHRIPVRQVMVPLSRMVLAPESATVAQIIELMRSRNTDRVALYKGASRSVRGFVTLVEVVRSEMDPQKSAAPLLTRTIRLTAGMSLTRAFRQLRTQEKQTALVVDTAGRVVGFLCLRDIARYIASPA